MSATFKLAAKKKYTQNDLRRLMHEQKAKSKQLVPEQKIESPLAKYNDAGQLTCILCKSVVRSESVWKVHVNSKAHKENVQAAKLLKEKLENSKNHQFKKPAEPAKFVKSENETSSSQPSSSTTETKTSLPQDFFDTKSSASYFEITLGKTSIKKELINIKREHNNDDIAGIPKKIVKTDISEGKDDQLPEGFFDDPIKDAKIRNQEYKDPQEEEWERFQREIKEESTVSNAIIAEEQEEATAERQIEEIDEQIQKWSKVLDLEKKKEIISNKMKERCTKMDIDSSESDEAEEEVEEFDEFLDWRAKRLYS